MSEAASNREASRHHCENGETLAIALTIAGPATNGETQFFRLRQRSRNSGAGSSTPAM
jgi:hypothetical protein